MSEERLRVAWDRLKELRIAYDFAKRQYQKRREAETEIERLKEAAKQVCHSAKETPDGPMVDPVKLDVLAGLLGMGPIGNEARQVLADQKEN